MKKLHKDIMQETRSEEIKRGKELAKKDLKDLDASKFKAELTKKENQITTLQKQIEELNAKNETLSSELESVKSTHQELLDSINEPINVASK